MIMDGATTLEEVHRESDGELVGYVSHEVRDGASIWVARTLFGGELRTFAEREHVARYLRAHGLPLLAEKWWYRPEETDSWLLTFLIEARLGAVQVRFGYDPDPANVAVLRGAQLDRLSLRIPPARR